MAAEPFSPSEWEKIRETLSEAPERFGLPRRVYGSLVMASFNIRKLGKVQEPGQPKGRDAETMRFLADVCMRFDLIAVQEVMADLSGIRRLRDLMGEAYGLIVSDTVGAFPGDTGNKERLAFLYNRSVLRRGDLVSEVSTSQSKVLKTIAQHHQAIYDVMNGDATAKAWRRYVAAADAALAAGNRPPRPPKFAPPVDPFIQFIRNPFAANFAVRAQPGAEEFEFLAVNAHLLFGSRKIGRQLEAKTVLEWILGKVQTGEEDIVVLLGDLNFDYDHPKTDLKRIRDRYRELGARDTTKVFASFPFVVPHPKPHEGHEPGEIFRSNIRLTQSFDQIGIFSRDPRLKKYIETTLDAEHATPQYWGRRDIGPDYGVFNFTDLFCQALVGEPYRALSGAQRKAIVARYQYTVSDHMPIWFRAPLPVAGEFPTST